MQQTRATATVKGKLSPAELLLESSTSYTCTYNKVPVYVTGKGEKLKGKLGEMNKDHVILPLYVIPFPKLKPGSEDYQDICNGQNNQIDDQKLTQKYFKQFMLIGKIGAAQQPPQAVFVPGQNAFITLLDKPIQERVRDCFVNGMLQAVQSDDLKNFPGFIVNIDDNRYQAKFNDHSNFKCRVIQNKLDAIAPTIIATLKKLGIDVGVCTMPEGLKPIGNGGLSDHGWSALDEYI